MEEEEGVWGDGGCTFRAGPYSIENYGTAFTAAFIIRPHSPSLLLPLQIADSIVPARALLLVPLLSSRGSCWNAADTAARKP